MRVHSLNIGRPQLLVRGHRRLSSAINRRPVNRPVELDETGFDGDRVSDLKVHGSPDQAACCYPHEHYAHWSDALGVEMQVPGFGENLTTEGLLEAAVCVGDTLRVGRATVQISQPRQPCGKLALKHDRPDLPQLVNSVAYTGFYLRVIEPGPVTPNDEITLLERPHHDLTVERLTRTMLDSSADRSLLNRLASLPELSRSWRDRFAKKRNALDSAGAPPLPGVGD
ncbi:MAG: MOSC domain-containing protein [Planctomycetota bacterium]|nr:MOSC domain-containing protein [Planctomycetota bacterium]